MTARHSFGRRWTDAPSIQPERIPCHRAPKHRADVAADSCRWLTDGSGSQQVPCLTCAAVASLAGRHRAEVAS